MTTALRRHRSDPDHTTGRGNGRRRWLAALAGVGLLAWLLIASAGPAAAGGWAVTTLDAQPTPAAGEDVRVGFTIRQHGVTPVDLDGVSITVTDASGRSTVFAATQEGPVGHYVADVFFPADGQYRWSVQQGWFAEQPLGSLLVEPPGAGGGDTGYRFPAVARYGLIVVMLAGAAVIVGQLARRGRRPAAVA
jgi:hypothetical protein